MRICSDAHHMITLAAEYRPRRSRALMGRSSADSQTTHNSPRPRLRTPHVDARKTNGGFAPNAQRGLQRSAVLERKSRTRRSGRCEVVLGRIRGWTNDVRPERGRMSRIASALAHADGSAPAVWNHHRIFRPFSGVALRRSDRRGRNVHPGAACAGRARERRPPRSPRRHPMCHVIVDLLASRQGSRVKLRGTHGSRAGH